MNAARKPPTLPDTHHPTPKAQHPTPFLITFRDSWDKIGLVLGVSLTWALLLAGALTLERLVPRGAPLALRLLFVAVLGMLLLPALLGGAFHVAHLIARHEETTYADFWHGARRWYRPALALTACDVLAAGVLGVNLWFYSRVGHIPALAVMLLCSYLLLFGGMMAVTHFPLLILQETGGFDEPGRQARRGVLAVLRRAFYLALSRPFAVLGLLVAALFLAVAFSLTGVLFVTLAPGILSLLLTHVTRATLVQLGAIPAPPPMTEAVPDEKFRLRL